MVICDNNTNGKIPKLIYRYRSFPCSALKLNYVLNASIKTRVMDSEMYNDCLNATVFKATGGLGIMVNPVGGLKFFLKTCLFIGGKFLRLLIDTGHHSGFF